MSQDTDLLQLARTTLTTPEFDVWFVKHYRHQGRRAGSLQLGITEEQFRHRLHQANLKIDKALKHREDAA